MVRKLVKVDAGHKGATLVFLGDSLDVISGFPDSVKRNLGHAIRCVQSGIDPPDSKPMTSVGPGVYELRDFDGSGWYRVIYLKKVENTVYVLHCFNKKSRKTPKNDLRTAIARLKALHVERAEDHKK